MKLRSAAALGLLAAAVPLAAEDSAKQWLHVNKTDRVEFAPGGTIRVTGSHGDLNIEGWDRPEVEITVTKSTVGLYSSKDADDARKRLDLIGVKVEAKSATELAISTTFPSRTLKRLCRGKSDIILGYQIHVPRNSHLVVHHDSGTVFMSGVQGDVEASARKGDILLMLASGDGYSVDAKVKLGNIHSDVGGAANRRRMVGRRLAFAPAAVGHRIVLRVGVGGIDIQTTGGSTQ